MKRARFFALALALAACSSEPADAPATEASGPVVASAPAAASAPAWPPRPTFAITHDAKTCALVITRAASVDDPSPAVTSTPVECPADLHPGERVRRTGRICMRETPDPSRALPTVCPHDLVIAK